MCKVQHHCGNRCSGRVAEAAVVVRFELIEMQWGHLLWPVSVCSTCLACNTDYKNKNRSLEGRVQLEKNTSSMSAVSQPWIILYLWGHLVMPEDFFGCHNRTWTVCYWHCGYQPGMLLNTFHPMMHRTANDYLAQNIKRAKLRNPGIYHGVKGKELVLNICPNNDCGMVSQLWIYQHTKNIVHFKWVIICKLCLNKPVRKWWAHNIIELNS